MKRKNGLLYAFIGCLLFSKMMADPSPYVIDLDTESHTLEQLGKMDDQYSRMKDQLEQQTYAVQRLESEIAQLQDFQNPNTVRELLLESNKLIAQSKDIEYKLNNGTDFAKSYQGYKPSGEMKWGSGSTYDSFYKDNANMTLSTINSANKAIEDTNKAANDPTVNSTVAAAQGHIINAQGTTQAVSGLAEINVQTLQQLQAMNIQLAALSTAQNAAAAKKIQEEATATAEYNDILDKDAAEPVLKNGDNVMPNPSFSK